MQLFIMKMSKLISKYLEKNTGQKRIKPFVLIVAKDTNHAETIRIKLESKNFFRVPILVKLRPYIPS